MPMDIGWIVVLELVVHKQNIYFILFLSIQNANRYIFEKFFLQIVNVSKYIFFFLTIFFPGI